MKERRLKRLLGEAPFLLLASVIVYVLDPGLSQALSQAAQNSPSNYAWFWNLLSVITGLHLELVIAWLGWLAAVLDATIGN
jgi:hypothetical protein